MRFSPVIVLIFLLAIPMSKAFATPPMCNIKSIQIRGSQSEEFDLAKLAAMLARKGYVLDDNTPLKAIQFSGRRDHVLIYEGHSYKGGSDLKFTGYMRQSDFQISRKGYDALSPHDKAAYDAEDGNQVSGFLVVSFIQPRIEYVPNAPASWNEFRGLLRSGVCLDKRLDAELSDCGTYEHRSSYNLFAKGARNSISEPSAKHLVQFGINSLPPCSDYARGFKDFYDDRFAWFKRIQAKHAGTSR